MNSSAVASRALIDLVNRRIAAGPDTKGLQLFTRTRCTGSWSAWSAMPCGTSTVAHEAMDANERKLVVHQLLRQIRV